MSDLDLGKYLPPVTVDAWLLQGVIEALDGFRETHNNFISFYAESVDEYGDCDGEGRTDYAYELQNAGEELADAVALLLNQERLRTVNEALEELHQEGGDDE